MITKKQPRRVIEKPTRALGSDEKDYRRIDATGINGNAHCLMTTGREIILHNLFENLLSRQSYFDVVHEVTCEFACGRLTTGDASLLIAHADLQDQKTHIRGQWQ